MERKKTVVIAIDGPAGSGKSTIAAYLARRLGFVHLNSGALFRSIGFKALERGIALDDDTALTDLARETDFQVSVTPTGETQLLVDGADISIGIAGSDIGEIASKIGLQKGLRDVLADVQRTAAKRSSLVVEGRDAGTVVFPNADAKFFLEASIDVRALRRFKQLNEIARAGGDSVPPLEQIRDDIAKRDERDRNRPIAPQVQARDALLIDTSHLSIDEVVTKICGEIDKLLVYEKQD